MHARLEEHLEQKFPVERGVSALTGAPPGEDNACVARSGVISRMIALVGIVRLWEQKDQRQLCEKRWWCLPACAVAVLRTHQVGIARAALKPGTPRDVRNERTHVRDVGVHRHRLSTRRNTTSGELYPSGGEDARTVEQGRRRRRGRRSVRTRGALQGPSREDDGHSIRKTGRIRHLVRHHCPCLRQT